jgi:hypothetical protein
LVKRIDTHFNGRTVNVRTAMTCKFPMAIGKILTGSLFNEPMRVETVQVNGPASWVLGLVGTQSERFRKVTLTADSSSTSRSSTRGTPSTATGDCFAWAFRPTPSASPTSSIPISGSRFRAWKTF